MTCIADILYNKRLKKYSVINSFAEKEEEFKYQTYSRNKLKIIVGLLEILTMLNILYDILKGFILENIPVINKTFCIATIHLGIELIFFCILIAIQIKVKKKFNYNSCFFTNENSESYNLFDNKYLELNNKNKHSDSSNNYNNINEYNNNNNCKLNVISSDTDYLMKYITIRKVLVIIKIAFNFIFFIFVYITTLFFEKNYNPILYQSNYVYTYIFLFTHLTSLCLQFSICSIPSRIFYYFVIASFFCVTLIKEITMNKQLTNTNIVYISEYVLYVLMVLVVETPIILYKLNINSYINIRKAQSLNKYYNFLINNINSQVITLINGKNIINYNTNTQIIIEKMIQQGSLIDAYNNKLNKENTFKYKKNDLIFKYFNCLFNYKVVNNNLKNIDLIIKNDSLYNNKNESFIIESNKNCNFINKTNVKEDNIFKDQIQTDNNLTNNIKTSCNLYNFNESPIFNILKNSSLYKKLNSEILLTSTNELGSVNKLGLFSTLDRKRHVYVSYLTYPINDNNYLMDLIIDDVTDIIECNLKVNEAKSKSKILAKIVHEFKTPIITLITLVENFISDYQDFKYHKDIDSKISSDNSSTLKLQIFKHKNLLKKINNKTFIKKKKDESKNIINLSEYIQFLINDIINSADNSTIKITKEDVNVIKVLNFTNEITDALLASMPGDKSKVKKLISIDEEIEDLVINSDETRLKQVLLNLISNAVKFTNFGYIKLSAKLNNLNNSLILSVSDTGIGLQKEEVDKIIGYDCSTNYDNNKYNYDKNNLKYGVVKDCKNNICSPQLKSSSILTNKMGTGVGLNVVKLILKKLDYELKLESEYGKGTTFSIIINNVNCNAFNNINKCKLKSDNLLIKRKNSNIKLINNDTIEFNNKDFYEEFYNSKLKSNKIYYNHNINNNLNKNNDICKSERVKSRKYSSDLNKEFFNYFINRKEEESLLVYKNKLLKAKYTHSKPISNTENISVSKIFKLNLNSSLEHNSRKLRKISFESSKTNNYEEEINNSSFTSKNSFGKKNINDKRNSRKSSKKTVYKNYFNCNFSIKINASSLRNKENSLNNSLNNSFNKEHIINNIKNIKKHNIQDVLNNYVNISNENKKYYYKSSIKKNSSIKSNIKANKLVDKIFKRNNISFNIDNVQQLSNLKSNFNNTSYFNKNSFSFNNHNTILVIDDSKLIRDSTTKLLKSFLTKDVIFNYESGNDGSYTIFKIIEDQNNGNKIKIVFTDENMSYINGTDSIYLIKTLINNKKIKNVFMVIISADDSKEAREMYKNKGADYVLPKPLNKASVAECYNYYLNNFTK